MLRECGLSDHLQEAQCPSALSAFFLFLSATIPFCLSATNMVGWMLHHTLATHAHETNKCLPNSWNTEMLTV